MTELALCLAQTAASAECCLACAKCGAECGSLDSHLALASGRTSRENTLRAEAFASRANDTPPRMGPVERLRRDWQAWTAMKCAPFLAPPAAAEGGSFRECFCSRACRAALHPASGTALSGAGRAALRTATRPPLSGSAETCSMKQEVHLLAQMAASVIAEVSGPYHSARSGTTSLKAQLAIVGLSTAPQPAWASKDDSVWAAQEVAREALVAFLRGDRNVSAAFIAEITQGFYDTMLRSLEQHAWALDGASLEAPLAAFVGDVIERTALLSGGCDPDVEATELQAALLLAVGPLVHVRSQALEAEALEADAATALEASSGGAASVSGDAAVAAAEKDAETEDLAATSERIPPCPLTMVEAQATRPALHKALLSGEDIASLRALSATVLASIESDVYDAHGGNKPRPSWKTIYLHTAGLFARERPALLAKLLRTMRESDEAWNVLKGVDPAKLSLRCVEHHIVGPGGALPDPTHFDNGSLLTIDVMLADPRVDFDGGALCTMEADGALEAIALDAPGDAAVFVSHKFHCVRPVTRGTREVLVMELWEGEPRVCPHRCGTHYGRCPYFPPEAAPPAAAAAAGVVEVERQVERPAKRARVADDAARDDAASNDALAVPPPRRTTVRSALLGTDQNGAAAIAPGSVEGSATQYVLQCLREHARGVLGDSAFAGWAFFPTVAALAQTGKANVEVSFEGSRPIATVRALCDVRIGDVLSRGVEEAEEDDEEEEEEEDNDDVDDEEDEEGVYACLPCTSGGGAHAESDVANLEY